MFAFVNVEIPSVTLEGSVQDWELLMEKYRQIKNILPGLSWWYRHMDGIMDMFLEMRKLTCRDPNLNCTDSNLNCPNTRDSKMNVDCKADKVSDKNEMKGDDGKHEELKETNDKKDKFNKNVTSDKVDGEIKNMDNKNNGEIKHDKVDGEIKDNKDNGEIKHDKDNGEIKDNKNNSEIKIPCNQVPEHIKELWKYVISLIPRGSGGDTKLAGWIHVFCPYNSKGKELFGSEVIYGVLKPYSIPYGDREAYKEWAMNMDKYFRGSGWEQVPKSISETPVKLILYGVEIPVIAESGFYGIYLDSSSSVNMSMGYKIYEV